MSYYRRFLAIFKFFIYPSSLKIKFKIYSKIEIKITYGLKWNLPLKKMILINILSI